MTAKTSAVADELDAEMMALGYPAAADCLTAAEIQRQQNKIDPPGIHHWKYIDGEYIDVAR